MFARAARRLHLISVSRRERLASRLAAFDDQVRMFGPRREANYTAGFLFTAAARIIGWFDLWIILNALGHPQDFVIVVIAAAAGMIIGTISGLIPLGIGADEGGQAGLFKLLGPGIAVGLSLSLIRRMRTLAIAGLGLTVMLIVQLGDQFFYRRSRDRLRARFPNTGRQN